MKFILLLFLLSSCAYMQHEKPAFMTHGEILAGMLGGQQMDGPLTKDDLERKAMIDFNTPDKFFGDDIKGLKTQTQGSDIIADIDLRHRDTSIKKQWNGTCTAFAGVAALENMTGKGIDLSERDAWHWYRKYSCRAFINALTKNRICEEKYWPQNRTSPTGNCKGNRLVKLDKTTYIKDNISLAISSLQDEKVVYLGMTTPRGMLRCNSVISPNTGSTSGGHALAIVGYKKLEVGGPGYFILKNSWGSKCGDKGYHYLPTSICKRSDFYCIMWTIDKVSDSGINPDPTPDPVCKKVKYCKRIWYKPWKFRCWWKKVCK